MPVQDITSTPEPVSPLVARSAREYDPRPPRRPHGMAAPPAEPAPPILRNGLLPLSLVATFALVYWARLPVWLAAIVASPLMILFVLAPTWATASARAFDRDALRLRAAGRGRQLRRRFDRALGMRLFAAPAIVAERLGDVLREQGDAAGARRAYLRALEAAGPTPTLASILGLAHAAYAAGEHAEAIGAYRRVLEIDDTLPRVRLRLAHALLRRGTASDLEDAREALDAARPASDGDRVELSLLRAYLDARQGRASAARSALDATDGGDATLRDEILEALAGAPASPRQKPKKKR